MKHLISRILLSFLLLSPSLSNAAVIRGGGAYIPLYVELDGNQYPSIVEFDFHVEISDDYIWQDGVNNFTPSLNMSYTSYVFQNGTQFDFTGSGTSGSNLLLIESLNDNDTIFGSSIGDKWSITLINDFSVSIYTPYELSYTYTDDNGNKITNINPVIEDSWCYSTYVGGLNCRTKNVAEPGALMLLILGLIGISLAQRKSPNRRH